MAGIWEAWRSEAGEIFETCCIITTDGNDLMQPIHDRMPVILDQDQWQIWLSPKERQPEKLLPFFHPHSSDGMQAWPITRELNRVGVRDDAGLLTSAESER